MKELDNKLPPWWLYGFYATIIFRRSLFSTIPYFFQDKKIKLKNTKLK
ncbi:cbb3-type cytochrome c oxidase N-terminal domain-containing protein [Mesonia maritima]